MQLTSSPRMRAGFVSATAPSLSVRLPTSFLRPCNERKPCTKAALPRTARLRASAGGAGESTSLSLDKVEVFQAVTDADRDAVFTVWATVKWTPDDADDAQDTQYVLARVGGRVVAAARLVRAKNNAEFSRIFVQEEFRGKGIGRMLVNELMRLAAPVEGAIYVDATRNELGFFSLLGFEAQGSTFMHEATRQPSRHMVYQVPVCAPAAGECIGLHHTALRVQDIERSLAWYGSVGFTVYEKYFTPAGQRACFIEGLGVRIELMESTTGSGLSGVQDLPGFLVFDVTRGCSDLQSFLDHLKKRNGGILDVKDKPAHEVIGANLLSSVVVEDPDGICLKFVRREGNISASLLRPVDW